MKTTFKNSIFNKAFISSFMLFLSACQTDESPKTQQLANDDSMPMKSFQEIAQDNAPSPEKQKIIKGVELMLAGDTEKASIVFNEALLHDPSNSGLHLLNAMNYHIEAKRGDITKYSMAEAGYLQAIKHDSHNVHAFMQLGRVMYETKKYHQAQEEFSQVLLLEPSNTNAMYELAKSSYMVGDMKTARVTIERILKAAPNHPSTHRAAALIFAATGKQKLAMEHLEKYTQLEKNRVQAYKAQKRIQDWKRLFKSGRIYMAASDDYFGTSDVQLSGDVQLSDAEPDNDDGGSSDSEPTQASPEGSSDMIVVDGIVMRVSETGRTQKGNNILDNFTLAIAPGTYMYARGRGVGGNDFSGSVFNESSRSITGEEVATSVPATGDVTLGGGALSAARLFTSGISAGTIFYSMKIANAERDSIQVIGRPSLVAKVGKEAKFFSGDNLKLAVGGNFGGNITSTPVGVTLKVTPVSINGDRVTLDVEMYGSLLIGNLNTLTNASNQYLQIGISNVRTSVEVKFGDTVMLAGLTERIDIEGKSGFPGLQDIPGIQYFFSRETTQSEHNSVMYLMTPRRYSSNVKATQAAFKSETNERPMLTELELRNKDWYSPYQNEIVTLKALAPIYHEYRTGDLIPVKWSQRDRLKQQITQILTFLWY